MTERHAPAIGVLPARRRLYAADAGKVGGGVCAQRAWQSVLSCRSVSRGSVGSTPSRDRRQRRSAAPFRERTPAPGLGPPRDRRQRRSAVPFRAGTARPRVPESSQHCSKPAGNHPPTLRGGCPRTALPLGLISRSPPATARPISPADSTPALPPARTVPRIRCGCARVVASAR